MDARRRGSRGGRFRLVGLAAVALLGAALVAGCSGGGSTGGNAKPAGAGGTTTTSEAPPVAKVTTSPADGTKDVPVLTPVQVTVAQGKLDQVTVANADGKQVKGQVAADGASWSNTEPLGYGKTYSYTGQATGTDGKKVALKGSFTTLNPAKQVHATINPIDNQTVGVAMPISIKFESPVTDRKAVQQALKVTPPEDGVWAWLSDTQVDYRPQHYWPENTKVHVDAKLYGLAYGGGAYGRDDLTTDYTIGRNQVVKIDTPSHQLVVLRDGQQVASYPASFGLDNDADRTTPNGTYAVMEKFDKWSFDNPKYGYTNVVKKWAVRISNHGEFIHENNDNAANIGKKNSSHGCANLLEADAKAYFDSALVGDPVEVTGSIATMPTQYEWNDWLFTWAQWQSMSAL